MKIPKIGEMIDNQLAFDLCKHYQFQEIASRIEAHPEQFKAWKFDGASMLPDNIVAAIANVDQEKFSEAALKHDLKYAYGISGDKAAKKLADQELEDDLVAIKLTPILAKMMHTAVVLGGGERRGKSYSWAFGRID